MFNDCRCCQCYEISKCFIMSEVKDPEDIAGWRKSNEIQIPTDAPNWKSLDIYIFSNGQHYSPPRKYHLNDDELHWWDATLNYLARTHYGPTHAKVDLYSTNGRKVKTPLELANGVAYVAVEPPDAFIDSGYDRYLIRASKSLEKRQPKKSNDESSEQVDLNFNRKESDKPNPADIIETVFTSPSAVQMSELKFSTIGSHQQNGKVTKPSDKKRSTILQRPTARKLDPHQSPVAKKANNKDHLPWNYSKITNKKSDKIPANMINNLGKPAPKVKMYKTPYKSNESAPKLTVPAKIDEVETDRKPSIQTVKKITRVSVQSKTNVNDSIPVNDVNISDKASTEEVMNNEQILPVAIIQRSQEDEVFRTKNEPKTDHAVDTSDNSQGAEDTLKYTNAKTDVNAVDINTESPQLQDIVRNDKPNEQFMALINRGDIINFRLNIEIRNAEGAVTNQNVSRSFTNMLKSDKCSQVNNIEQELFINSKSWQSMYPSEAMTDRETKIIVVKCACCEKYYNNNLGHISSEAVVKENKKCILVMSQGSKRPDKCPCNDEATSNLDKTKNPSSNSEYSAVNQLARTLSLISLDGINKKKDNNDQMPGHLMSTDVLAPDSKHIQLKLVDDEIPKGYGGESRVNFAEPSVHKPANVDIREDRTQEKFMDIEPAPENPISENTKHEDPKTETIVPNNTFYTTDDKEMPDIVVVRKVSEDPNARYVVNDSTQTDWEDILLVARQHENGRYSFHLPPLSAVKNFKPLQNKE